MMLLELNKSCHVCTACLLTEYRFGLFSFSASLYWIMAFKCGSLSSTWKQMHSERIQSIKSCRQSQGISRLLAIYISNHFRSVSSCVPNLCCILILSSSYKYCDALHWIIVVQFFMYTGESNRNSFSFGMMLTPETLWERDRPLMAF